jgi:sialate O-acetylesterase
MSLEGNWKALPIAELFENNFYKLNLEGGTSNPRPNFVKISAWTPTSLFNGMINPLIPYTIKGAAWYQGESNVGFEDEYKVIFKNMIEGWRSKWNYDFPFYFVQIAPYNYNNGQSAALRDAQRQVTSLSNTGMVVTLDIGNPDNIHPAKKNEVGKRLSNLALGKTYGYQNKLDASYPISIARKNNIVTISFDCVEGGELELKSTYSDEIEVSADNIDFYKANAVVEDCFLHLYSNKVKQTKYVRHAWSDAGSGAILNSKGIPVSTFLVEVDN